MKTTNIEEKAHAGNATQNIHPPLMQKTSIHIQPHTVHHLYIYMYLLKIHEKHTQSKGGDRSTALARPVEVTYYWGLKPVYVSTTYQCRYSIAHAHYLPIWLKV